MNLLAILSSAFGLIGAALATPIGQAFSAKYMLRIRQERALARLNAIPEYEVGAILHFFSADIGGGSAQVGDTWILIEKSVGRVLLRSYERSSQKMTDRWLPMTCREFEAGTAIILK